MASQSPMMDMSDSDATDVDESDPLVFRSRSGQGFLRPIRRRGLCSCSKREIIRFSCIWSMGLLAYGLILTAVLVTYTSMPPVVPDSPETNATFSEERAMRYLNHLVQQIGSRPYGTTRNLQTTKGYLLGEIEKIRQASIVAFGAPRLEVMVRRFPGQKGHRTYWDSMENILVRVFPQNYSAVDMEPAFSTVMISAHYDTVTYSKGAYDDTSGVAVAMEILRIVAMSPPAKNQFFVMLNNGEEAGLLGARSFVQDDPLYQWVDVVINMDSTPGTKAIMLRSSGSELDYLYRLVPRPFASAISADIFNARLIDSETDFIVYTQQTPTGQSAGFDFAMFQHRQTYHTMKDNATMPGSLQFLGDNVLALLRAMLELDTLSMDAQYNQPNVIYSVLQSRAIVYSRTISFVFHLLVTATFLVAFPLLLVYRLNVWRATISEVNEPHPITTTVWSTLRVLLVVLVALIISTLLGLVLRFYNATFYYNNVLLGVCTFAFPTWLGMYLMEWVFARRERRHKIPTEVAQKFRLFGIAGFWLLMMVATLPASFYFGSTYLVFWFGLFSILGVAIHHILSVVKWVGRADRDSTRSAFLAARNLFAWVLIFFVMTIVPVLLLLDIAVPLSQMIVADMPSLVAGPLIGLLTVLVSLNFLILSRRAGSQGFLVLLLFIVASALFITASVTRPYSSHNPYQIHAQHEANYGSHNASLLNENSTFPIVESYILLEQVQAHSLKLGSFAVKNLHYNDTKCNPAEVICQVENVGKPSLPQDSPPTIKIAEDLRMPNVSRRALSILVHSPESFVHEISMASRFGTILNCSINNMDVQPAYLDRFLLYLSGTDGLFPTWRINVILSSASAEFDLHISSRYDELSFSPALQELVRAMPNWSTIAGEGEGMVRVDSTWTF